MKRKLFKQIRNEWKSNLWLATELLLISVVVWYVLSTIITTLDNLRTSPGYNVDHTFVLSFDTVGETSPNYRADRAGDDEMKEDFHRIYTLLKQQEGVVAVAYSASAVPYNYNFNGMGVRLGMAENFDSTYFSVVNNKAVSTSYPIVMDIHGFNGETPEELSEYLRQDIMLVSSNFFDGKEGIDDNFRRRIGDDWRYMYNDSAGGKIRVITPQKRDDYEPASRPTIVWRAYDEEGGAHPGWFDQIVVRVEPDAEKIFEAWVNENMGKSLSVNNVYISDIVPTNYIREQHQSYIRQQVTTLLACIGFLLATIFLGLLGTFWFRTQQRVGEIAIRKVNGATAASIMRREFGEGLLLLVSVTPVALLIDWFVYDKDLMITMFLARDPFGMYCLSAVITFALLALMIIAGIWFPARKAMKIDPARALADE